MIPSSTTTGTLGSPLLLSARLVLLISLGLALTSAIPPAKASAAAPDILAFGDLRGYVEPCGCDPETDLGGLGRLYQFVSEQRKIVPGGLVVDLGNNFPTGDKDPAETKAAKARAIEEGLRAVAADATLVRSASHSAVPNPVLSNSAPVSKGSAARIEGSAAGSKGSSSIPRSLIRKGTLILGVLGPEESKLARPIDEELIKELKGIIAEAAAPRGVVLLYAGADRGLQRLRTALPSATFIRSNRQPADAIPDQKERQQPGLLLHQGVYSVPSFGQGLLALGAFNTAPLELPVKRPGQLPAAKSSSAMAGSTPGLGALSQLKAPFAWLTREFRLRQLAGDPMVKVLDAYKNQAREDFRASARRKANERAASTIPYAGAHACQSCHPAEYQIYQKSAHAHALDTLKGKGQDENGECVSCHVVGYDETGGYIDQKHTPRLAGVQCETCHGPRKAHTRNPMAGKGKATQSSAMAVCTSCHHPPHSSAFAFEDYWPKIRHGKGIASPEPPAEEPALPIKAPLLPPAEPSSDAGYSENATGSTAEQPRDLSPSKARGTASQPSQATPWPNAELWVEPDTTGFDHPKYGGGQPESCGAISACIHQYDPVCGELGGRFKTFSNSCVRAAQCATPAPAAACGLD